MSLFQAVWVTEQVTESSTRRGTSADLRALKAKVGQ